MVHLPEPAVAFLTFPGVAFRQAVQFYLCKATGTRVESATFYQRRAPFGIIQYERTGLLKNEIILILGPFIFNSIVAGILALPVIERAIYFRGESNGADLALLWFAFATAMQSSPRRDEINILRELLNLQKPGCFISIFVAAACGVGRFINAGKSFWTDFIYAMIVCTFPSALLAAYQLR